MVACCHDFATALRRSVQQLSRSLDVDLISLPKRRMIPHNSSTMAKLSPVDQTLKQSSLPDDSIITNIGIALSQEFARPHVLAYLTLSPFLEIGKEVWAAAEYELHSFLCDAAKRAPKQWVNEVISGDVRELTIAILAVLVASLYVPLSIAVPITALVIKRQLTAFCRRKPRKPRRTISEILDGLNVE